MNRVALPLLAVLALTAACSPQTLDPNEQIFAAVQQTLAAIPTYTPYPPPATLTPAPLAGLFCEYQFCIGHPADMAFFDISAQRSPLMPSTASQGFLAAYNSSLVIQLMWQSAPGASDAEFMLDLIIDKNVDARSGNLDPFLVRDLNVLYAPITSTATSILPFGGASAWTCGGRAFAWKAYTPQPDLAKNLLDEALKKFRCAQ